VHTISLECSSVAFAHIEPATVCPASRRRFAKGKPMASRPINASFTMSLSFGEVLLRGSCCEPKFQHHHRTMWSVLLANNTSLLFFSFHIIIGLIKK
jgi:hypothetical protein